MNNFDGTGFYEEEFEEFEEFEEERPSSLNIKKDTSSKSRPIKFGDLEVRGHRLFKTVTKKEGNQVEVEIGYATLVDSVEKNLENKEVRLVLRYYNFDSWETATIERGKLVKTELKTFLSIGVDIGGKKADDVLYFLDKHEKKAPKTYNHAKLGWLNYDGDLIFRLNNAYKKNGEYFSKYKGPLQIEPKGSYKGWFDAIHNHVIGWAPLELILATSFASPIIGLMNVTELAEVDTFLLNIVGNSTTGKTTAAVVVASIFGSPSMTNNGLIQSFNATSNALQSIISGNMGVPIIYDETSMNMLGNKALTSLIYKLAQNKDKARLSKESILRDTDRWATAIFFTGEASLLENAQANEGLHVRLFEFKNIQWTNSAEHSEILKDLLSSNYGHAGVKFVRRLLEKDPKEIKDIWQSFKEDLEKKLPDTKFSSRVSTKFALILAAAHLANEFLELRISIENITKMLIEQEEASMDVRELAPKFYQILRQYIIQNKRSFKYKNEEVNPTQKIFGKIEVKEGKSYCYIFPLILREIAKELGFPDSKILLEELKKGGYLKHDKDKNIIKKQVFTKQEQEARRAVLNEKNYSSKGDYTNCIVYEGDIFSEFSFNMISDERKISNRKVVENKNIVENLFEK